MINTNDWLIINSVIYNIYNERNIDQMRSEFFKQLAKIIDFDAGTFYMVKEFGSDQLDKPIGYNCTLDEMTSYMENPSQNYSSNLIYAKQNIVYKHSSIMTEDERIKTQYYKAVYLKKGWHYSIHNVISYNNYFVGLLSLFRNKGKLDFNEDDVMILECLKWHLASRLYSEYTDIWKEQKENNNFVLKYGLTIRENQLLYEILNGEENEVICEKNYISYNTLRKHLTSIYKKVGVTSKNGLNAKFKK